MFGVGWPNVTPPPNTPRSYEPMSSAISMTMFGFFCAAAGVLATVTAAKHHEQTEPNGSVQRPHGLFPFLMTARDGPAADALQRWLTVTSSANFRQRRP